MGLMSLIGWLFGSDAAAPPPDAIKLDGTTEAALARSLSALPPDERAWITFAEAHLVLDQGRTIRIRRDGRRRQKKHRVVRGAAPGRHEFYAGRGAGLFRAAGLGVTQK